LASETLSDDQKNEISSLLKSPFYTIKNIVHLYETNAPFVEPEMRPLTEEEEEEIQLDIQESAEEYVAFSYTFYDFLRSTYNTCSAMLEDEYKKYKKLGLDEYMKYNQSRYPTFRTFIEDGDYEVLMNITMSKTITCA
jgi:hypothetical protein